VYPDLSPASALPTAKLRLATYSKQVARGGGKASTALEGGALACQSASPHLLVVGARNPVAVPYHAWHGGELRGPVLEHARSKYVGKAIYGEFRIYMYATGAKISRSAGPICFFKTRYY
jgi:hypothetical protein